MPELPEVETTCRGIRPHLLGRRFSSVVVREHRLRWPVSQALPALLHRRRIGSVERRAKYLLLGHDRGSLIIHLGMSGSLRLLSGARADPGPHDHVDFRLGRGLTLRYTDPRRFGAVLHTTAAPEQHPLLSGLGPEPLGADFDGDYLYRVSRGRRTAVKSLIMDARLLVGVGNIYANEALFRSGIRPQRQAGRISRVRYRMLADSIRAVLAEAIEAGGTTLRDFLDSDGRPGYFRQELAVYGRVGMPCRRCGLELREVRLGQRSTVYCPACQR